jgi:DNA-directed RNA polymerase specialized sigma24 family protein
MRKENRSQLEIVANHRFTIYLRIDCASTRRELCQQRDSGAVAIAPLVRRAAAFCFTAASPPVAAAETGVRAAAHRSTAARWTRAISQVHCGRARPAPTLLRQAYRLSHDEIAEVPGVSHGSVDIAKALVRENI